MEFSGIRSLFYHVASMCAVCLLLSASSYVQKKYKSFEDDENYKKFYLFASMCAVCLLLSASYVQKKIYIVRR